MYLFNSFCVETQCNTKRIYKYLNVKINKPSKGVIHSRGCVKELLVEGVSELCLIFIPENICTVAQT